MALIVCTECGKLYDVKAKNCPFCNQDTSEARKVEKIVLNIKNTRKGSRGFKDSKIINEIHKATRVEKIIAKKFLDNMEHPHGKHYVSQGNMARNKEFVEMIDDMATRKAERSIPKCPRCHSASLGYDTKKLSVGRGIVGGLMGGAAGGVVGEAVGITLGGLSSKKGYAVCLKCGKRWKI